MMKWFGMKKDVLMKYAFFFLMMGTSLYFTEAFAADGTATIGTVAANLTGTFANIAKLITALSYIAGLGFGIGSILKFKQHKDNPQQIPVGTPIALLFVAAALLFLPSVFQIAGATLGLSSSGGVGGVTTF